MIGLNEIKDLGDDRSTCCSYRPLFVPPHLQNSDHASLWASSARLVSVVSRSPSLVTIGLTHSQPPPGASKLAHPAIKLVVIKAINISLDIRHASGAFVRVFEGGQPSGLLAGSAQPPVTEQTRQRTEQTADACNG